MYMLNSEDSIHTARMRMILRKFTVLCVKIEDMFGFPHCRPLIRTFTAQDLRPIYNERLPAEENIPYANKTK